MGRAAQATDGAAALPARRVAVVAPAMLHRGAFEEVPEARVRIAVGRSGARPFAVAPLGRTGRAEGCPRLTAVDRRAIPAHQPRAAHLAPRLAQECTARGPAARRLLPVGEEAAVRRDRADHGALVVGAGRTYQRRFANGRGAAGDAGPQGKARLVSAADRTIRCGSFAARAGPVSACHAASGASLRGVARRTGFCSLRPSCRTRRLTCAGGERTSNLRQRTPATRLVVHPASLKASASAPFAQRAGRWARGAARTLGTRPARGWRQRAATAPGRARVRQVLTAACHAVSAAAIDFPLHPA